MNFKNTLGISALFTLSLGISTFSFADSIEDLLDSKAPINKVNNVPKNTTSKAKTGLASYYAHQFHGRKTASGERFNMHAMTVAHKTLPFGTKLKVTCESTGKSVVVKVNDRGPFHGNRVLDLSYGAAKALGTVNKGVSKVKYEVLN